MENKKIQFALGERFNAPLPEFYVRRIIFWKDEEREFEKELETLELPDVKLVRLTENNNFAVKNFF